MTLIRTTQIDHFILGARTGIWKKQRWINSETIAHDIDNTPKKMTITCIKKTHQNTIQFQTSSHNREIVTHTVYLFRTFFHTEQKKTKMGARKLRVRSLNYVFLEQFFPLLSFIDTHRGHISYSLLQFIWTI